MWHNLTEASLVLVVGLCGVFASLLVLAGMIALFRWTDEFLNKRKIRSYAQKVETQKVPADFNDEVIAVIAAAAEAVLKRPIVVRKMHFIEDAGDGSWAASGRSRIMSSHTIDRK